MASHTSYVCPHCGADMTLQSLLPPLTYSTRCTGCRGPVRRTGGAIRDAWRMSFLVLGLVPLYALVCYVGVRSGPADVSLLTVMLYAFFPVLTFGSGLLMVTGWFVGLLVCVVAGLFASAPGPDGQG